MIILYFLLTFWLGAFAGVFYMCLVHRSSDIPAMPPLYESLKGKKN